MAPKQRPKTLNRALRVALQNYGVAAIIALTLMLFIPWWLQWSLLYLGGILFLTSVLMPFVDDWRPKPRVPVQGKAVFISGCDTGFGHSLAQRLDDLGLDVFAGCLFPEKDGAQTLKKSCSARLHVVPLDVTSDDSVQNAVKYVTDNIGNKKLWSVVNNAGVNAGGELAWTGVDIIQHILQVNTFGVVRVTKAFLPLLCKDKGRVVTVASAAGRYTYPGMVPYCMSKQATVSFCEGLRIEMYRFGVKFVIIEPYMYKTPITNEENILRYVSKTWNESSSEIKELYPENYIEIYKRRMLTAIGFLKKSNPQEVVACLEEAVTAIDPKYCYNPGTTSSKLGVWFLPRLPKHFADAILDFLHTCV